ncbi:glutathione S-transferase family protein [Aliamphritea spongicola]|uniref:glutathione S-transferase family protein n=1 Tax=Aliamphritea spongicola TaxID=707589 RepID=UPI00196A5C30|nr:glutathione S-transferase family protein [Aliamphritea spongicola]MBN3563608.1 glutathione S-transferase family protein [Aliamphritea spongicola]
MELIIGNKNYSSWSLRPWLMLKACNIEFDERRLALRTPEFAEQIKAVSPTAKVPALIDGDVKVWDSLAICEYLNDTCLNGEAWPSDPAKRAQARAISCEMHSGFMALREELPMNCRARRFVDLSTEALKDVWRIDLMWQELRYEHQEIGPWLFGELSIADFMYAPVALRFNTYGPAISPLSKAYVETVMAHPAIMEWVAASAEEEEVLEDAEVGQAFDG